MIKRFFKTVAGWIVGVIIAGFIMSLWKNEEVDWDQVVFLSIAGIIGAGIVLGIKYTARNKE
ncbi:hypothetical protein VBD025_16620 [Virgibacillus flavescens]|uniref:hypothetical protein n=1 Tax=Virgibacillus flavescens TaxID=1611422 RepID=UPI003D347B7C